MSRKSCKREDKINYVERKGRKKTRCWGRGVVVASSSEMHALTPRSSILRQQQNLPVPGIELIP